MVGDEGGALVEGVAALNVVADLEAEVLSLLVEELGVVLGSKSLEVREEVGAHAVEHVVGRDPEGVAAGLGEDVNLEHRVVGGDVLEADVAVPRHTGPLGEVVVDAADTTALVLALGADDLGLGRVEELGSVLGHGVNAHVRLRGAARELADAAREHHHVLGRDVLAAEEADAAARDEDGEVAHKLVSVGRGEDLGELEVGSELAADGGRDLVVLLLAWSQRRLGRSSGYSQSTSRGGHCTS